MNSSTARFQFAAWVSISVFARSDVCELSFIWIAHEFIIAGSEEAGASIQRRIIAMEEEGCSGRGSKNGVQRIIRA